MRDKKVFIIRILIGLSGLLLSFQSLALELPVVNLDPKSKETPELAKKLRYMKNFSGELDLQVLAEKSHELKQLNGETIQFGRASEGILILLRVKNVGDSTGVWVFSTDRGSATSLQIYHLKDDSSDLRFDSQDFISAKTTLAAYSHYADEFSLSAGEDVTIAVVSDVEDSAYFPLVIQKKQAFFASSHLTMMLAAGSVAAILALLVMNLFFYLATGRKEFVWLVAAEFFLATVVMYLVGFFSTYLFYDSPMAMLVVGDITKYAYVVCMAQFARVFLQTEKSLANTDQFLKVLIGFSLTMIIVQLFSKWISVEHRIILHSINYLVVAASAFYFLFVGIYATKIIGRENWPLIIAWGSLAAFAVYAAIAFSGLIPFLPLSFYAIAPVAVVEAAFATLAIGLTIRKTQVELVETKDLYLKNLEEKLKISESAKELAEEKNDALKTIVDQSTLLHALGHDSQQVLLGLNSVISTIESQSEREDDLAISSLLKASTEYLDQLATTSMSGARLTGSGFGSYAISVVNVEELLQPLITMYKQPMNKKGIRLNLEVLNNPKVLADRPIFMRAISNLLENSMKFTQSGKVDVRVCNSGDKVSITIADTGCGISDEKLEFLNSSIEGRANSSVDSKGSGSGYLFSKKLLSVFGCTTLIDRHENGCMISLLYPQLNCRQELGFDELRSQELPFELIDWDSLDFKQRNHFLSIEHENFVVVTSDESVEMRRTLSTKTQFIFYKPLCYQMIEFRTGLVTTQK